MIDDLIYRCPLCGYFEWLDSGRCRFCNAQVRLASRSQLSINSETRPVSFWYKKILDFDLPGETDGIILKSRRVQLSREAENGPYRGFGGINAIHFIRKPADTGSVCLTRGSFSFSGQSLNLDIPFGSVSSMTIESNTIIVVSPEHGPLFFDFLEESGKKWEDAFQKALREFHAPDEILEFYPMIRRRSMVREHPSSVPGHERINPPMRRWYPRDHSSLFSFLKVLVRPVIKKAFSVTITGLENIPEKGAAILMPNHTSFMDSIILGVMTTRNVWFMAKNSEYRHPFLKWFLRIGNSFPVRRYINDVLAVRNAARVIQGGHILGIFPEGERTWDGEMLPLRYGTMRLILSLGAPVIPVGITGAYELMPRWTGTHKRVPVSIRIGKPLRFDPIPVPRQTHHDIMGASRRLKTEISDLLGVEA
jgi:1-acyl-sn-glycerol-3-phosphate acyltransferase